MKQLSTLLAVGQVALIVGYLFFGLPSSALVALSPLLVLLGVVAASLVYGLSLVLFAALKQRVARLFNGGERPDRFDGEDVVLASQLTEEQLEQVEWQE